MLITQMKPAVQVSRNAAPASRTVMHKADVAVKKFRLTAKLRNAPIMIIANVQRPQLAYPVPMPVSVRKQNAALFHVNADNLTQIPGLPDGSPCLLFCHKFLFICSSENLESVYLSSVLYWTEP